jgi:hypothetical protein
MKPNRVAYTAKYAVELHVPRRTPERVTCEFAWQAQDVVARAQKRRENMVDGATITKARHGQSMQSWTFDAEEVRWHSVYARNSKPVNKTGLTAEQRTILVKLDKDLEELGFQDQLNDLLSEGWDDTVDAYLRAGKKDVWWHYDQVGEEEDRHIYEEAEQLWDDAREKIRALPQKNPAGKRYVLVEYEFDRAAGRYKREHEEPIRLQDFVDDNAHDEEIMSEMKRVHALPVGGEVKFGGGAAPLTAIRRIS